MIVFRAYNIRGNYGEYLIEAIMTRIDKAAATLCPGKFTVGQDFREHCGVKIVFPDSWVLIRASNTSPILRLSIEAREQKRLNELKNEITKLIKSVNA